MSDRRRTERLPVLRWIGAGGLRACWRCCRGLRDRCRLLWVGLGLRLLLGGENRGCVMRLLELVAAVVFVIGAIVAPDIVGGIPGDGGEDCNVEVCTGFVVGAIRLVL